jgi:transmembrane sensor
MSDRIDRLRLLLQESMRRELSYDEQVELDSYLESYTAEEKKRLARELPGNEPLLREFSQYYQMRKELEQGVEHATPVQSIESPLRRIGWIQWVAAASIIASIITAAIYLLNTNTEKNTAAINTPNASTNDVPPGTYTARLRLSDGTSIILDSAGQGLLAQQGTALITNDSGNVKYQVQNRSNSELLYNTLETGAGQSYALTLSDGTKVWLNAKSSLHFPVAFESNERVVVMQGEVFFEVAKNAKAPFKIQIVKPSGEKAFAEVLGTQFNINAYDDETSIHTTLVDGRIKISSATSSRSQILTPGQQVVIDSEGNLEVKNEVNVERIMAWKEQRFYFRNDDLKTMMRQLARWYDIEVIYEGEVPNKTFTGMVSRNTNLSEVLTLLQSASVPFRIEGKKLVITKG